MNNYINLLTNCMNKNLVRSVNLISSYLVSGIVLIGVLAIFNNNQSLNAETITNFVLLVTIAGGFELGLVKSSLINIDNSRSYSFKKLSLISKVSVRAIIPSIIIFLLWTFLNNDSSFLFKIIFSYCLCIIGILSSELRVIFDNNGNHSTAVWTKQGGITLGILTFVFSIYLGYGDAISLGMYCLMRVLYLILLFHRFNKINFSDKEIFFDKNQISGWKNIFGLSLLAVISGNIDRILISYFLDPLVVLNYFLIYEIFTKYWLIAVIVNPIIFVQFANGGNGVLSGIGILKILGVISIISVAILVTFISFNPMFFNNILNISINNLFIILFFIAIVINCVTQIASTLLLSRGYAQNLLIITITVTLVIALTLVYALTNFGVNGLLVTWLIKSCFEGALVGILFSRERHEFLPK